MQSGMASVMPYNTHLGNLFSVVMSINKFMHSQKPFPAPHRHKTTTTTVPCHSYTVNPRDQSWFGYRCRLAAAEESCLEALHKMPNFNPNWPKKALGPDNISPHGRNRCAPHLSVPLISIFRKCLTSGKWSSLWKVAKAVAIHKKRHENRSQDLQIHLPSLSSW